MEEIGLKRMLIIMPDLKCGGAEKSLINFLNECDFNLYNVDLLLFRKSGTFINKVPYEINIIQSHILQFVFGKSERELAEAKNHIFKFLYASIIKLLGNFVGILFGKRNAYMILQYRWNLVYRYFLPKLKKTYDVAVAYLEGEATYYLVDCVKSKTKIAWFHSDFSKTGYTSKLYERFFKSCYKVVSVSEECVNILKQNFKDLEEKFIYLENITSSQIVRDQANEFYPREYNDGHKFHLLSIGRLHPAKGFDIAIDAAKHLKDKNIDFCWYIIGDGELFAQLHTKIVENNLENNVCLLGLRENPYPYINNCNIFVQTSRYEGKSMVIDEAKILCKPIIVTNYPTVKDQIKDGEEGVIAELDANDIASKLYELLNNNTKRESLIQNLKRKDYGNTKSLCKYYDVFERR